MTFTDSPTSIQCCELYYICIACISIAYNLSAEAHLAISLLYRADLISITWKMPSNIDSILVVKNRSCQRLH